MSEGSSPQGTWNFLFHQIQLSSWQPTPALAMVHIENTKFLNVQNYAQFEHTGEASIILSSPVIITQMISLLYVNITRTNEQLKQI
jgi:hypothetical protein